MKKIPVLFVILFFAKGISAQIDSIGKGELPRLVRWYEPSKELDTAAVDSSIYMRGFTVHRYDDIWKHDRVSLGNFGSESFSLYPGQGRMYFRDSELYRPYFQHTGSTGYYNVTMPFTRASYGVGPNEEQKLNLIHSQNVTDQLNFTASLKRVTSDGFYVNQGTAIYAFGFTSNYFSKDKKYTLHAEAGVNSANNRHNNGITDNALFTEDIQPNRQGVSIFSQQAYMEAEDRFFQAYQTYRITNPSPDSVDERKFGIELRNKTRFRSTGTRYVDDAPSPEAYAVYGISPQGWLVREQHYSFVENTFETAFNYGLIDLSGYYHIHSGKLSFPSSGEEMNINDHAVGGTADLQAFDLIDVDYDARSYFLGFNQGGVRSDLKASVSFDSLGIRAEFEHLFDRNRGNLNFHRFYADKALSWENDFDFVNHNLLAGRIMFKDIIRARIQYHNTENALYFGTDAKPVQGGAQRVGTVGGGLKIKLWHIVFDLDVAYNKSFNEETFRIPEIISKNSVYFQSYLFSDKLELKTGVDVFYLSPYRGNAFQPLTGAYYIQNDYTSGNMVYPNYFLDVRIHNTKVFLKVSNFLEGVTEYNYMPVPGHPMQDFVLRYGVAWDFLN